MNEPAGVPLIRETELRERIRELGARISDDYAGERVMAVGVLKGGFMFLADLVRAVDPSVPLEVEFVTTSSYGAGTASSGQVRILQDITAPVHGRHVLLVDDILDSGLTLVRLRQEVLARGARSVRIAVLLDKEAAGERGIHADYVGFRIPRKFVVGYGLDLDGRYRNLKEVRVLDGD